MNCSLPELIADLRASRGFAHKTDIGGVVSTLQAAATENWPPFGRTSVPIGDDLSLIHI